MKPISGWVDRTYPLLKRRTWVRFPVLIKHCKNLYPPLPSLTFNIKEIRETSTARGEQVGRWQLDSKTKRLFRCLLARATWWIKIVITILLYTVILPQRWCCENNVLLCIEEQLLKHSTHVRSFCCTAGVIIGQPLQVGFAWTMQEMYWIGLVGLNCPENEHQLITCIFKAICPLVHKPSE